MKRFALFAFAFTWLAACDSPSAPTPQTPMLKTAPTGALSFAKLFNEKVLPADEPLFNPCPPEELVAITGFFHFVGTRQETPAGSNIKIHVNLQGVSGVGTSGDRYSIQQNEHTDLSFSNVPPFPFSQETDFRFRMIRQGSDDNLWVRETYRFSFSPSADPPFVFEPIRSEFECRG